MKMAEAMSIINDKPPGYMVSFERHHEGCKLSSDHFPDKHAGEKLIETEQEAWRLAQRFADKMGNRIVNVYVIGSDFVPVLGYRNRIIRAYP